VATLLEDTKSLRISVPIYSRESAVAEAVGELEPLAGRPDETDIYVLRDGDVQFDRHFDETTGFDADGDGGVGGRFY
jgi:CRISPR-associated endonuclease/helicase Cas3/CRISPR-associated endonuclease Cas3-HD